LGDEKGNECRKVEVKSKVKVKVEAEAKIRSTDLWRKEK
jgi:hypothetical protein